MQRMPLKIRISDPYSFDRIQGFDNQKLKKFTAEKKIFTNFLNQNYNLPIPRPPYRTSKLQKKPSAFKREHPALQNMKFLNFFLLLWVIFALLDLDPDPKHC
jgi:hypothetical protein